MKIFADYGRCGGKSLTQKNSSRSIKRDFGNHHIAPTQNVTIHISFRLSALVCYSSIHLTFITDLWNLFTKNSSFFFTQDQFELIRFSKGFILLVKFMNMIRIFFVNIWNFCEFMYRLVEQVARFKT